MFFANRFTVTDNAVLPLLLYGCRFPGSDAAYDALTECCDVRLLAEAIVFTSTAPSAANAIFNVSNGDVFRWNEVRGGCACSRL
jgi:hypothetical protein